MSTAYLLLLLFLCVSLNACNARHLNPLDKKKVEKKPYLSIKIDDRNGSDSTPMKLNEDDNKLKSKLVADSEKTKNNRSTNKRVEKSSVSSQTESLVSVSWRVPHKKKKRSQKHIPWFTLDYSPPKTHPPSHN